MELYTPSHQECALSSFNKGSGRSTLSLESLVSVAVAVAEG